MINGEISPLETSKSHVLEWTGICFFYMKVSDGGPEDRAYVFLWRSLMDGTAVCFFFYEGLWWRWRIRVSVLRRSINSLTRCSSLPVWKERILFASRTSLASLVTRWKCCGMSVLTGRVRNLCSMICGVLFANLGTSGTNEVVHLL